MGIDVKMDNSLVREMEKDLEYLDSVTVEYGYFEDQVHLASKLPLPLLASYQNDGVKNKEGGWHIIPREFMDLSHYLNEGNIPEYNAIIQDGLMYGGRKQLDVSFKMVGQQSSDAIRESIETQDFAPLRPVTIKMKGSDTILVETGQLHDDATYKITKGGD